MVGELDISSSTLVSELVRVSHEDDPFALARCARANFLTEYRWKAEQQEVGVGALIMIYDHETRGLEETLTQIQHKYRTVISSTTHIHLDDQNCLEILAVRGAVKTTQNLAKRLMKERGVKQLKLAALTI